MKSKSIVVISLLLVIIAIFVWLGYVLIFPKRFSNNVSKIAPPEIQVESVLAKKVATDHIKPVKISHDPFLPLSIKLDESDLMNLLKAPILSAKINKKIVYVSGVKGHNADMVTLSLNGRSTTFDFDSGNTHFLLDGKKYVVVYFNPTLEGALIMNLSNGKLNIVNSQGMIEE